MTDRQKLVLVTGLVCDQALWANQVRDLGDLADPVLPPVRDESTMQEMAAAALAAAPERFALAGFSMGGYVALEMLRQAPDRITRLAVLDTSARADDEAKAAGRARAIEACERGEFAQVIEGMISILLHPDRQQAPLADFVRAMAARVGSDAFVRRHRAMMTRTDARDLLRGTNVPILVVCGRQDAMSPVGHHEEMAELAPRGRLSVLEHCGHMAPLEQPQAVNALMREWLTEGIERQEE